MNRRIIAVTAASMSLFLLPACNQSGRNQTELYSEIDSLNDVNSDYSRRLQEMDSLIADVLVNFEQINSMEGMINLDAANKEGIQKSQADRIKDNMALINQKMAKNKEAISTLQKHLNASDKKVKAMALTIQTLEKQFKEKVDKIAELTEELNRKNIIIAEQAVEIEGLKTERSSLEATTQKQKSQIDDLYKVRYCIGTKQDLKDMGVLNNGQVATDNYTAEYFTQIDRRNTTSIALYAKKAELLTKHPEASYEFVPGRDKMLTLEIKNQEEFWSMSKVLVVLVR